VQGQGHGQGFDRQVQGLEFKDRNQGLWTAGIYHATNTNYFMGQALLGFSNSMLFSIVVHRSA